MQSVDILIVGAGHAGAQAAMNLRQCGFAGSILMVGREPEPPYERPALSKDYLLGTKPFERMLLRPASFWSEREIRMQCGVEVIAIDAGRKCASLSTGETIGFQTLIWAAGGDARRLSCPGAGYHNVHTLRTRGDLTAIQISLSSAEKVAVVGGGYVGLETAAGLRKLGKEVTLIENLDRVLARVAGETISRFFEAEHRRQDVDIRLETGVDEITGEKQRATGVRLTTGELVPADAVVVGIGISPAVQPLLAAGAAGSDGVDVDPFCRTSLDAVYAIGDCAKHDNAFAASGRVRLESVQNANDQAMTVARAVCGDARPYDAVPWFWSHQYDLKLQTVGLSQGHHREVVRGEPASGSFSVIYLRDKEVVALDCINCVKDYVQGRQLVESRTQARESDLADSSRPLRDLAR